MLNKIKFIITVFLLFISCSSEVNAYRDKEISNSKYINILMLFLKIL